MLVSAGYSEITAQATPGREMEAKGVKEELNALGFTVENANSVVGTILLNDKEAARDRLKAAELVYKVNGSFGDADTETKASVINIFNDPNILIATRAYEESLKQLLSHGHTQSVPTPPEAEA